MKICPSCFEKNEDACHFCAKCGTKLDDVPITSDIPDKAGDGPDAGAEKTKQASRRKEEQAGEKRQGASAQEAREQTETSTVRRAEAVVRPGEFVDPDETLIAAIGNGYPENLLSSASTRREYMLLTERRVYYAGKRFLPQGLTGAQANGVVSVEDISYTEFQHQKHFLLIILSIFFALVGGAVCLLDYDNIIILALLLFLWAVVLLILYFVSRKSCFLVYFPGGYFGIIINAHSVNEGLAFQRQLHRVKDLAKEEALSAAEVHTGV